MIAFLDWYMALCLWARSVWFAKFKELADRVGAMSYDTMDQKIARILAFHKGFNALVVEVTKLDELAKRGG